MSLEKIDLPPRYEFEKQDDGTVKRKEIPQWEIRATGKDVQALRGAFKDSAPQMMHEGWKEWQSIGETKITRPDGSTDVVRADKEALYRSQPGFCVHATRPTFTCNAPWEGSLKRLGIRRQKILYRDGQRIVLEEKHG